MSANIKPIEMPTNVAGATSELTRAEIVVLPFGEARRRVVEARRDCETLQQGVHTLQRCLWAIEGFAARIDDGSQRESLQRQIESLNRLLLLRQHELSDIKRSLQEALRPVRRRPV